MGCKMNVEETTAIIPVGEYDADVRDVRDQEGQHGPMVRIEFKLSPDDEFDGYRTSGLASKKLTEATKLGRWVATILGQLPPVGEEITVDDLLGKRCRVVIAHKRNSEGKAFANVSDVVAVAARR